MLEWGWHFQKTIINILRDTRNITTITKCNILGTKDSTLPPKRKMKVDQMKKERKKRNRVKYIRGFVQEVQFIRVVLERENRENRG